MEDNIEVAIRVRPLLDKEIKENLPIHWHIDGESIFQVDQQGRQLSQPFTFDHIFSEDKNNTEVFDSVVQPLIESGMTGYNSTVFAYGQTSSGKTYTMLGCEEHQGIIPLTIENIFESINRNLERKYLLRLSYIEIYNDVIIDLLDETPKTIKIREDTAGAIHLNVEEKVINSPRQAYDIIEMGEKRRKYGITQANQRSSRSHTIFRIVIESTPINEDTESDLPVHVSHINLVDLAGSERASHTKATGVRLREGGQINKSLHQLSMVIRQLSEGKEFTSFRDSKLTRILKDSLGGNAKTLIIGTITPTSIDDSHSTLAFTYQAKTIKNKPTVNEIRSSDVLTKQYIQKEKQLQKQLAAMQRDKKLLEDKHAQMINELSYFKQQFVTSSRNNKEERRRHTLCFGSIKPKVDNDNSSGDFRIPFEYEFVSRRSRVRKQSSLSSCMEDNITPRKMEWCNFSESASKLDNISTQKIESFETVYKEIQNLVAVDLSEPDNKDHLIIGLQKMYDIFCMHVLEPQKLITSEQTTRFVSDIDRDLLNSPRTLSNNSVDDIFIASKCEQKKVEDSDISKMDCKEEEQADEGSNNFSFTKLLEENQTLKSKIRDIKSTLDKVQEENTTLKSEISNLEATLMKTEDELLAVDEQLDYQERQALKLKQEYNEVSLQNNNLQLENDCLKTQLHDLLANNKIVTDDHIVELVSHKTNSILVNVSHNSSRNELESIKYMSHNFLDSITNDTHSNNCSFMYSEKLSRSYGVDDLKSVLNTLYHVLCFDSNSENEEQMHFSISESSLKEIMLQGKNTTLKNKMETLIDNHTSPIEINKVLVDKDETFTESFKDDGVNETEQEEEVEEDSSFLSDETDIIEQITILKNNLNHKERLNHELTKKCAVLQERLNQQVELNAELNEINISVQNELIQKRELNSHLNEEIAALQSQLDQKILDVSLTENKLDHQEDSNEEDTSLKQNEELSIRSNEEIIVKQGKLKEVNICLSLQDKLNQQELDVFSNKEPDQQRIINVQLNEEKHSLQQNLNQKEYEIKSLILERDLIRGRLIQHEQLNTKLTEEKYQLEDNFAKQQLNIARLTKEKGVLEDKLNNKLTEGQGLLQDCKTKEEFNDEDIYLKEKLLHQQQLNDKLTEEQHLLRNEITQEQSNAKRLLKEKNLLHERVAQQEVLNAKLMEELVILENDNVKLKEEEYKLIEQQELIVSLENKLAEQTGQKERIIEEKHGIEEKLAEQKINNEENLNLKEKLLLLQQLNDKLTEEQHLFRKEITQEQSNAKRLLEEKNLLHERVAQQEVLNAKLMEELLVLKNDNAKLKEECKLIEKQELIVLLERKLTEQNDQKENIVEEKRCIEEALIQQERELNDFVKTQNLESKRLHKEHNDLKQQLLEHNQLNNKMKEKEHLLNDQIIQLRDSHNKLIEEKSLLENMLNQQEQDNLKLMNEKRLINNKLLFQEQLNAKLSKDISVLQDDITKQQVDSVEITELIKKLAATEELNSNLIKEKCFLQERLDQKEQDNLKLSEERNKLFHEKQQCKQVIEENAYLKELNKILTEEKNDVCNNLAIQEQLNVKLTKDISVLKSENLKISEKEDKLTKQKELLANLVKERNVARNNLCKQEQLNLRIKKDFQDAINKLQVDNKKLNEEKNNLSHTIVRLSDEKQNFQRRIADQQQAINNQLQIEKHLNEKTLAKYRLCLSMLIEKYKDSCKTPSGDQQILPNAEFLNDTDLQNLVTARGCDEEWQVLMKQLHDIVKTKDKEIEHLDKEIVDTVCHVRNLEKIIKEQNEQLSHFKSQQVSKLKNQEMSLTDFKKRRSITQDTNRGLDSLEEPFLCPTCSITESMELNRALLRESRRKNIIITKLENDVRQSQLQYKRLVNEEYETLKVKYTKMKEIAVMRGNELKKYQTQT